MSKVSSSSSSSLSSLHFLNLILGLLITIATAAAAAAAAENSQSSQPAGLPSASSSIQGGGGTSNKNNPRKLDGMDILVIIVVTIATLLSLFIISGVEFKLHRNRLHFAASNKAPRFSRGIVSEDHCKSILSEIYRTNTLVQQMPLPENDCADSDIPVGLLGWCFPPPQTKEGGGLNGFDDDDENDENSSSDSSGDCDENRSPLTVSWVHYKTTLSMMHGHFERCAVMNNPKNVRPPWMPFRMFAESVAGDSGKKFADTYEEARYSPKEYGPGETRKLLGKMAKILQKAFPEESARLFAG